MPTTRLDECIACGNSDCLEEVIDFGLHPPANLLLESPSLRHGLYPLCLNHCIVCGNLQLSHAVSREELFGSGYTYASGTGGALDKYFSWFASCLSDTLPESPRVLEIACNDGSLMRHLAAAGMQCVGVEPDLELAREASGVAATVSGFWPDVSGTLDGRFDCVLALNVLAHVTNPLLFLYYAALRLTKHGIIVIQTSQSDFIASGQFDSIYAEHISYPSVSSMRWLARRANLILRDVFDVRIHGHSRIWVLSRSDYDSLPLHTAWSREPFALFGLHHAYDFSTPKAVWNFRHLAQARRREITQAVSTWGAPVVLLGAAAKAMTVMRWCAEGCPRFMIDAVLDESTRKIGKWIPGLGLQIEPLSAISRFEGQSPLVVCGAWNVPSLLDKLLGISNAPAGILKYFPDVEISTPPSRLEH